MIELSAVRLHWLGDDDGDSTGDLCAHSPVSFCVCGETLVSPEDGDWTVSAAAIYLLRALEREHTKDSPVGDHIFPCCGHGIYDVGKPDVVICGCPSGVDLEICHKPDGLLLVAEDGRMIKVSQRDWQDAVLAFSSQVLNFYDQSQPKYGFSEEDRNGYKAMMAEWKRRHSSFA